MTKYRYERDKYYLFKDLSVTGKYQMPVVKATQNENIKKLISFNYWKTCKNPESNYLCFYIDDYQFKRVWNMPQKYLEVVKKFKGIIAPDFSLYRDLPTPLNIYNCWRNKVLMAYYQSQGIDVIPNVSWSDETSFSWCFDGLPINSVLAVSTNGCIRDKTALKLFLKGFEEMKNRLKPLKIIVVGALPKELQNEPNLVHFEGFNSMIVEKHKSINYHRKE